MGFHLSRAPEYREQEDAGKVFQSINIKNVNKNGRDKTRLI